MRNFQEFKGQSTHLDYNRERRKFVARPEPYPFVVRRAAREGTLKPQEPPQDLNRERRSHAAVVHRRLGSKR